MDGKRKGSAHKRVIAKSSVFSNSVFSVENFKKACTIAIRQQSSDSIHKQHGGYKIKEIDKSCRSDLAMVLKVEREITLTGEYLPGDMNIEADWESRHFKDKSSWKLDPEMFIHLMKKMGPCTVDLFADRTNAQLNTYFSWREDPHAQALDVMLQTWRDIMGYNAFPSFCMITPCLAKVREEKCQIVIVTPTCQTQPWYPLLLQMSIEFPVLIPMGSRTLTSPQGEVLPLIVNHTLQLAGWKVSGDITLKKVFQSKLKNFSCTSGNQAHNLLTTVPGRNGIAGVWNGQLIPFQPLWPQC